MERAVAPSVLMKAHTIRQCHCLSTLFDLTLTKSSQVQLSLSSLQTVQISIKHAAASTGVQLALQLSRPSCDDSIMVYVQGKQGSTAGVRSHLVQHNRYSPTGAAPLSAICRRRQQQPKCILLSGATVQPGVSGPSLQYLSTWIRLFR